MQRTVTQHVDLIGKWLQAWMLEEAALRTGGRVLEVGSGGYNAALAAEIVGPAGRVVSVDIDEDIAANARTALVAAGYPQVTVVCADGEYGHEPDAPYDAVLVTANTSDVPPAWRDQLADDGRLIVPLRMRGITRCLPLRRQGNRWTADAALQCGFVAMQGAGRDIAQRVPLRGPDVVLLIDEATPARTDADALRAALTGPRTEEWSPVTITGSEHAGFESLHLWLASQDRPFATLAVDRDRTAGLLDPQDRFTCPTFYTAGSFAYLTMRTVDDGRHQFGVHAFGPDTAELTTAMLDAITLWDQQHRHTTGPSIDVYPTGTTIPGTDRFRLLVPRRHTTTVITWPGTAR
jgi:protein-L-isoaspartate(D-aspartate) O-methyltransferase